VAWREKERKNVKAEAMLRGEPDNEEELDGYYDDNE
jgi:hypothetical protein